MCQYNGKHEGFLRGDETVLFPVGGGYENLRMLHLIELYTKKVNFTVN